MNPNTQLQLMLCSMDGMEKIDWIGYDAYGRGKIFRAPKEWSMARACQFCELLYPDFSVVTLRKL